MKTKKLIEQIKTVAGLEQGAEKRKYLAGLRDCADIITLIADDNKWPLAEDEEFQEFLDWIDDQKT